jgi:HK97 gp10 family phage protein
MIKEIETSMIWNGGAITKDMYTELQGAMLASAERMAENAKQLVPVGPGVPKHLRDTIRARGRKKRSQLELLAHRLATGDFALETAWPGAWVFAGDRKARVYWAHFVEYGTYDKPARPYLRPAMDANFNATLADAARAGQRVINKRRRERTAARKAARG